LACVEQLQPPQLPSVLPHAVKLRARVATMGMEIRLRSQLTRMRSVIAEGLAVAKSNAVLLVRTGSILAFWVFVSSLATRLGPVQAAAHHTMLNIWLLFVLTADAPGVAGQVLTARALAQGRLVYLRRLVRELATITSILGVSMLTLLLALRPYIGSVFTRDTEIRALIAALGWPVALSMPLVMIAVATESVIVGAGLLSFAAVSSVCTSVTTSAFAAVVYARERSVISLWIAIIGMFVLRFSSAAIRVPGVLRGSVGRHAGTTDSSTLSPDAPPKMGEPEPEGTMMTLGGENEKSSSDGSG